MAPVTNGADENSQSDEALLASSAAGDRLAFDALARRHLPRLYVLALRLCATPAEAEEIAQEAMLRAWRQAARFDPARGRASAWLNRITVNLAIDRSRTAAPETPLEETLAAAEPDAEAALARREQLASLAEGLAALPERQRAAVLLTYGEDRPGGEAAAALGVSARALEGLLRRARLFLRAWLQAREA